MAEREWQYIRGHTKVPFWPEEPSKCHFFSRNEEHQENYTKQKPDSFINNHQIEMHGGDEPDFKCSVIKTFKDPLSRQVFEGA